MKKADLFFFLIIFLSTLTIFYCQVEGNNPFECDVLPYLNETQCFNNILIFDSRKYQAGNFAANKNGDILLQFSEFNEDYSSRLFYGFSKDMKKYFLNQTSFTKEIEIDINEIIGEYGLYNPYGIYNSFNSFASINNDPNKNNQYLFSINLYSSLVELYNLNNDNNTHYIWNLNNFFNLDEDIYFFPYDFSILELKKE